MSVLFSYLRFKTLQCNKGQILLQNKQIDMETFTMEPIFQNQNDVKNTDKNTRTDTVNTTDCTANSKTGKC